MTTKQLISFWAGKVVAHLIADPYTRRATKYISPSVTVKATRQRKPGKRDPQETFIVTAGLPNYRERRFIQACKKAGEPFPVKKMQLDQFPKPK